MRVLLCTLGSLGDLHPYIAVGLGLTARGHEVTIATSAIYREKVEGEGLRFHAIRPDVGRLVESPDLMRKAYHPRTGSEFLMREFFLPGAAGMYEDLLPAATQADLLVGHPLAYALPIAAEALRKRWVSVILQPAVLLSASDPPTLAGMPEAAFLRRFGPGLWRLIWSLARTTVRRWSGALNDVRVKAGLQPVRDPALDGTFSPYGSQGWFSKVLASPQPDWPAGLELTGFAPYDKLEPGVGLDPSLDAFLNAGSPPVVFTLGSSAVFDAGPFYRESAVAVKKLGIRAVLLVGRDSRNRPEGADKDIFVAEYAPYSLLFPRAAAVVHQGGAGTTAEVLHAGVPAVFVPFSHDQPDNARRVSALGCARTIDRGKYRAAAVEAALGEVLTSSSVREAAVRISAIVRQEDGVRAACEGLERIGNGPLL